MPRTAQHRTVRISAAFFAGQAHKYSSPISTPLNIYFFCMYFLPSGYVSCRKNRLYLLDQAATRTLSAAVDHRRSRGLLSRPPGTNDPPVFLHNIFYNSIIHQNGHKITKFLKIFYFIGQNPDTATKFSERFPSASAGTHSAC